MKYKNQNLCQTNQFNLQMSDRVVIGEAPTGHPLMFSIQPIVCLKSVLFLKYPIVSPMSVTEDEWT